MKERKMAMVAKSVRMDEEDSLDVQYWLSRPPSERIAEVTRLRYEYYRWRLGSFPDHVEKTASRRKL